MNKLEKFIYWLLYDKDVTVGDILVCLNEVESGRDDLVGERIPTYKTDNLQLQALARSIAGRLVPNPTVQ